MPAGRPTDCTPQATEKAVRAARAGVALRNICHHIGVDRATFWRWMADDREPYRTFRDQVNAASAEREMEAHEKVNAGEQGWQSAAWVLERRFGHYAARGDDAPPDNATTATGLEAVLAKLPADVLRAALAAKEGA